MDCRWNVISASVDCRTEEERGLKPLKENKFVIKKSRYDSVDSYLSEQGEKYNDIEIIYDKAIYERLRANDIDHLLAQHIAHLFIRDTVSLFSEKVHQDDERDIDHFEVISKTIFRTIFSIFCITEYSVNELANDAFQATTTKLKNWLARGIQAL